MDPLPRPADRPPAANAGATAPDEPADPARAARLAEVRRQIAAGTYDTPGRFDAALDGLLADVLSDPED